MTAKMLSTSARPLTERQFQSQVVDLARLFNWRIYHPFLSKWSEKGYPDLTLVRPPRLVFAELKREGGRPTAVQTEWLDLLGQCVGVESYLWRPADLEAIAECLR